MAYRFKARKIWRQFRKLYGSVNELSKVSGVPYHTVQRALHGGRIHYCATVVHLARALNINPDEYLEYLEQK